MKKGFTLLELLIVIGILAILSTTMIIVINPAEMLKKARDSQRMSDLNTLKTAIAYYLTNASTIYMGPTQTGSAVATTTCGSWSTATSTFSNAYAVDGNGWVPINFAGLSGGSPIGSLPRDPNQSAYNANPSLYYVFLASTTTTNGFELVANLESTYYTSTDNKESTDGGKITTLYEVGTSFDLTTTSATCFPSP